VRRDADAFVAAVRRRLLDVRSERGTSGVVVVAWDTELFGHWWHEGPAWLEAVLRALPGAGVRVTTLGGAADAGLVGEPVDLPASSWGSGKDWRVWAGEQVADLVALNDGVQDALLSVPATGAARDPLADALAQEALLALSSDWAFMVSKDSAAGYARDRAHAHAARVREGAALLGAGDRAGAAARLAVPPRPFGHVDARGLRNQDLRDQGMRATTRSSGCGTDVRSGPIAAR
jgi:1,4-alpha-glucan branching enzyme